MARLLFLFSLSVLCVSISVAHVDDSVNYGIVNTILKSPIRKEYGKSAFNSRQDNYTDVPNNIVDDTLGTLNVTNLPIDYGASPSLDDVSFPEDTPREQQSTLDDGINKMTEIYRECTRKIDKRVESLLSWKFSKTNTAKDLIELKEYVSLLYKCLKVQSFRYFDGVINEDVIPLSQFVELVADGQRSFPDSNVLNLGTGPLNGKLHLPWDQKAQAQRRVSPQYVSEIVENDWSALLLDRLSRLLETHSMKFRLNENSLQARGRRRDQRMFAMMVMGFMIMATILIPMGFQFLTVLGGKSLLMAKMALIMSAINGLKKIATTPVGYGFYHTGPDIHHDHHHGFHDKLFKVGVKRDPEFL